MKNLIILLIVGLLAWKGYAKYHASTVSPAPSAQSLLAPVADSQATIPDSRYKCDGRTRCPQMTSCAEATYFVQNCPNTEMDGNSDGVPCEKQWCK
jgi:hypothetical protein